MGILVQEVSFGRLGLNDFVACGSTSQRKMACPGGPLLVSRYRGDSFAGQGNDAAVGANNIACSSDIKHGPHEVVPIGGVGLYDFDASGCRVVEV